MADERITNNNKVSTPSDQNSIEKSNSAFPMAVNPFNFNNTATAQSVASSAGFQPVHNPLHNYEQVAYHWQFYIGPDLARSSSSMSDAQGPNFVNYSQSERDSKVIIAESGLTGFNITNIEMENYIGLNFLTRNETATKFTITISEPLGANLPDKMFLGAKKLSIRNYFKCPYYLSLKFHGYNPESGEEVSMIGDKSWTWQILLTKMDTRLTNTGSVHTIEAITYNDLAHLNQFNINPISLNIDLNQGQKTIKEAVQGIQDQINANLSARYTNQGNAMAQPPYKIKIEDRPYESDMNAKVPSPFEHKIVREESHLDSKRNHAVMQISRGTDMGKIFDYLFSASETSIELANPSNGGAGQGNAENLNGEIKPSTIVHRIETKVEIVDYDPVIQEYIREITFIVKPYEVMRTIVSAQQDASSKEAQKKKFDRANQKLLMKKQYDYYFTGQNTEIINLDLNLNFNFVVASNFYKGHIFYEMASVGRQLDPEHYQRQEMKNWVPENPGDNQSNATNNNVGIGDTYLQDFRTRNFEGGSYLAETLTPQNVSEILPLSFIQDGVDPRYQVQPSIENNNLRSRSLYGMILNQLYSTFTDNLHNIEMEVRGDPYWLGKTNLEGFDDQPSDQSPQFSNGEHMFILKFLIPQGMDDDGSPNLAMSEMYSGFYSVTKVTHSFRNGKFTQNLSAVRQLNMSVSQTLGN